ncbi:hypothetical protein E2C01_082442 [Portunus trituberculatus]|uniref:Uncharacterized protein n=1 Tax=Portunus trituberculatus TaxID=210409 RepID=A0A5B7J0V7_PORTR|nr:hypothetical protein [Portunus trituberculatus]
MKNFLLQHHLTNRMSERVRQQLCVKEGRKWEACYHDNGEVDDLEGSCTHHHNNNNSGAFAWGTRHSQLTCTVCACLLIPIALSYCISCSAVHAFTPTALHYAPSCPPWASQHSTCPPS